MNDLSIVRVLVREPPRIIRIPVPGIPGPPGPRGPEGPPGVAYPYAGDAVKDEGTGTWSGTDHSNSLNDWIGDLSDQAASEGMPVKGRIPRGKYLFMTPLIKTTDAFQNLDIGGDGDATVLVNKNPAGGGFMPTGTTTGQLTSTDIYLTSPALIRDQVLTVNDASIFTPGQWIIIRDTSQPLYAYNPDVYSGYAGQAVQVRNIVDATHVRIDGDCEYNYAATTTTITRYNVLDGFFFHDFALDYDPSVGVFNYAMDFKYCTNVRVERILMENRESFGIRANESFGGDFFDIRDQGAHIDDVYSVEVQNTSAFWRVGRLIQYGGRHAFDAGGDIGLVPASDITVYDSMAIYPESNGFDTHNNCRRVTFDSVRTVGFANPDQPGTTGAGVLIRGLDCRVINSEFVGVGVGVLVANRGGAVIEGNSIWRCRAGVRIDNADRTVVRRNFMSGCVEHFIEHASAEGKKGFVWEDNIGIGNPSLSAFYMPSPTWDASWVLRNNCWPDSTNPYSATVPDQLYQPHVSTAAAYTLDWPDGPAMAGKPVIEMPIRRLIRQSLSQNDTNIPLNATQPFPIGTLLQVIQKGAGASRIVPAAGATINGLTTPWQAPGRYGRIILEKTGTDEWIAAMVPAILVGSATYNPPSLNTGTSSTPTTLSVPGAALGDLVVASFSLDLQGIALRGWVSAADTVSVQFRNDTGGTIDLGSGTLRAWVLKS